MDRPEVTSGEADTTERVEALKTKCINCGGNFIVKPSQDGNIAGPVGNTPAICPKSEDGIHHLNIFTL